MTYREISLGALKHTGENILSKSHYAYKDLEHKLGREPVIADFSIWQQKNYRQHQNYLEVIDFLETTPELHIKLCNGARAGSIAKVSIRPKINRNSDLYPRLSYDSSIEVEWDEGKKWKFKFTQNIQNNTDDQQHQLLIGYSGPTVFEFEKKDRPPVQIPTLYDNFNRKIKVGDWVMTTNFNIGKITRISEKGTLWIEMIEMSKGHYISKLRTERFGRNPCELLRIDLPEGFEATAMLMDKDVTSLDIIPTFTYDIRHD